VDAARQAPMDVQFEKEPFKKAAKRTSASSSKPRRRAPAKPKS